MPKAATEAKVKAVTQPPVDRKRLQLLAHRSNGLLNLGFTSEQALELVTVNDVVHEAQALLSRHWPHDWIVDELSNRKDA